jgi:hypothetical protein
MTVDVGPEASVASGAYSRKINGTIGRRDMNEATGLK